MLYGFHPGRRMPADNPELVRRLSLRWIRAADPHQKWAAVARKCQDYVEGVQWNPSVRAQMALQRRPTLTINKISPLYRLVCGYQSNNRMDIRFLPLADSAASELVGDVLNNIEKNEASRMNLDWTDSEVFADGMVTGRGFWDTRLSFEGNDLGEMTCEAKDPFSIYIDPDASKYDLSDASYIQESRWSSIEEIGSCYGKEAADAVENQLGPNYQSILLPYFMGEEITPPRYFGMYDGDKLNWNDVYHMDFIDRQAKRIRLIDTQYRMASIKKCFLDLETGDFEPIPDEWLETPEGHQKIEKCLLYAKKVGNPMVVVDRQVRRVRWTVTCGDILLFDEWSPYESYTINPFFPYFRRGKTRGMIEDLIEPQDELNKKRSSISDILNRNANSGWLIHQEGMDPAEKEKLRLHGAQPGINVEWKGEAEKKPARIEPGGYPQGLDRLEEKATNDFFQISGINESALGQLDRVQSGRAIEARQRQAILAIQPYQDNFARSKNLQGRKHLEIFQNHYTEARRFRIIGEDGKMALLAINAQQQTGTGVMDRINDITVGKYTVKVDQMPMSATFKEAQFEEALNVLQKLGPAAGLLLQTNPGLLVDMSSLPRKEEWKEGIMQAMQAASAMPPAGAPAGGAPPQGPMPGVPEIPPGTPDPQQAAIQGA